MRRLALGLLALLCAAGAAGPAQAAGPSILTTGDSMMRFVDASLEERLRQIQEVSFNTDVHIGDGITSAPWVRIARRQVPAYRPDATVAFMGANDGYNMVRAPCCGKAWIAKYEERVKEMIRIYSRKGRAHVYWLTLPAAESGRRRQIFPMVNRAIRRAVRASGPHAHVVDTWRLFTPGGRYRSTMLWNGEEVIVRSQDGVHLKSPGFRIAAELIVEGMRRDGVIG
jgi:hypothetical protein